MEGESRELPSISGHLTRTPGNCREFYGVVTRLSGRSLSKQAKATETTGEVVLMLISAAPGRSQKKTKDKL